MNPVATLMEKAVKPLAMQSLLTRERLESGVAYNPLSPTVRADPYPIYAELRRKDPVHRLRLRRAWLLTRFEDVEAVLRDHRRFGNAGRQHGYLPYVSMLALDPPEHTRIRNLAAQAFTPRAVASWEPRVREKVAELLAEVEGRRSFDLIREFAFPLPIIVIAEILGVPPEDRDQFYEWSKIIAMTVDPLLSAEEISLAQQVNAELFDYFEQVAEERRRQPRDDLISALVNAEVDGERLSREELLPNLVTFLTAGSETTRNLIGNGALALLRHREQLQRLLDDPSLLDSALEEMLRYDSPVQLDSRITREPTEIGGKRILPGDMVVCVLGAANRDPEAFPNPDLLDVGRASANQIAFGRGIHYCIGVSLARLEGRIAFAGLLPLLASRRVAAEPRFRNQLTLRGLEELWLERTGRQAAPTELTLLQDNPFPL